MTAKKTNDGTKTSSIENESIDAPTIDFVEHPATPASYSLTVPNTSPPVTALVVGDAWVWMTKCQECGRTTLDGSSTMILVDGRDIYQFHQSCVPTAEAAIDWLHNHPKETP